MKVEGGFMKKKLKFNKVAAIALAACISCWNLSINVQAQEGYLEVKQQILDEFLEANSQLAEKIIKEVAAVHGIGSVFCCKECF